MRRELEQAFLLQDPEGLTQGHAAGVGTQHKLAFNQPCPGFEPAVQDLLTQPSGEAVGQAFRTGEGDGGQYFG